MHMDPATAAKWDEWADARITLALNKHLAEMMQHLDERDGEIADAVAEELVRQVKALREEIGGLRAQMTIIEANASGRTAPTRGKRRVAA